MGRFLPRSHVEGGCLSIWLGAGHVRTSRRASPAGLEAWAVSGCQAISFLWAVPSISGSEVGPPMGGPCSQDALQGPSLAPDTHPVSPWKELLGRCKHIPVPIRGPSCSHSSDGKVRMLGQVSVCRRVKHVDRTFPLLPPAFHQHQCTRARPPHAHPTPSSPQCPLQGAFCLVLTPHTPPGSVPALPWLRRREVLTLGRPALTGEMVVHLVTYGFFPRVLASFSLHVQGRISGLGGELSQL